MRFSLHLVINMYNIYLIPNIIIIIIIQIVIIIIINNDKK